MDKNILHKTLVHEYGQPQVFFRDTTLDTIISTKYQSGIFLREPTFCDATYKLGGLLGNQRFYIISTNAHYIDKALSHSKWGLCIWKPNTHFKVIGRIDQAGKTQITLLEVPEILLPFFQSSQSAYIEKLFFHQAHEHFVQALELPILPELDSIEWRQRVAHPLGMDKNGIFFPIMQPDSD